MHFLHYSSATSPSQEKESKIGELTIQKKDILILHGRWGSCASWQTIWQGLAAAWYDVRIPDLAGHGDSPLPRPYTIDDYTQDIIDFIHNEMHNSQSKIHTHEKEAKSLNHQTAKIPIIAHSNGGRIAIHLAATHPELVSQLILVNSAGIDLSYDPSRSRQAKRTFLPPLSSLMKKILPQRLRAFMLRALWWHDYLATDHDENLKKTFLTLLHTFLEQDMQEIDTTVTPTTLIRGGQDSYTPLRQGKRIHRLIAWSKLIIHPKEKHGIHRHNPSLLLSDIKKELQTKKMAK